MFIKRPLPYPLMAVSAILVLFCTIPHAAGAGGQTAPLECFAVSDLVRIFSDGYHCPAPGETIEICGIRNEYLSAQCVIKANQDVEDVRVSLSPLRHVERSASLPGDAIRWNFVGSIPIAENTPKYRKSDLIRTAPARFADYLMEPRQISLKKDEYRAIYLTVHVPRDAEKGDYEALLFIEHI